MTADETGVVVSEIGKPEADSHHLIQEQERCPATEEHMLEGDETSRAMNPGETDPKDQKEVTGGSPLANSSSTESAPSEARTPNWLDIDDQIGRSHRKSSGLVIAPEDNVGVVERWLEDSDQLTNLMDQPGIIPPAEQEEVSKWLRTGQETLGESSPQKDDIGKDQSSLPGSGSQGPDPQFGPEPRPSNHDSTSSSSYDSISSTPKDDETKTPSNEGTDAPNPRSEPPGDPSTTIRTENQSVTSLSSGDNSMKSACEEHAPVQEKKEHANKGRGRKRREEDADLTPMADLLLQHRSKRAKQDALTTEEGHLDGQAGSAAQKDDDKTCLKNAEEYLALLRQEKEEGRRPNASE